MSYSILRSFLVIPLLSISCMALASNDNANGEVLPISASINGEISTADLERLMNKELAIRFSPIKSAEDFSAYLEATSDNLNPFNRLSPGARTRFMESLVFGARGLGSFEYGDLVYELTPTEIYKILYLFGMQHLVSKMQGARIETSIDEQLLNSGSVIGINNAINQAKSRPSNQVEMKNKTQPINQIQFLCDVMGFDDSCGGQDHKDHYCDGKHNCRKSDHVICTSNC